MSRNRKTASASPIQPHLDTADETLHNGADVAADGRNALIKGLFRMADILNAPAEWLHAMIPLIYYGFVCGHFLRNVYWGLVSILAGLCALSTMHPRFRTVKAKDVRGALYSAFGASSFAPIIQAVNKYGWEVQKGRMGLIWYSYVALFNGIGVLAYALRLLTLCHVAGT
ncbi:hemolysin-III channel Izh2 [Fusarium beomiforme]|uniref:Hemolysin-III channel Izh2 n=1 Tax=Fusarium beomiforme TaxID=44412 RepID=A0A9P5APN2_9HYPO|nr:hemolysin-III channel Izh2 [Fusarium beomiforme]